MQIGKCFNCAIGHLYNVGTQEAIGSAYNLTAHSNSLFASILPLRRNLIYDISKPQEIMANGTCQHVARESDSK